MNATRKTPAIRRKERRTAVAVEDFERSLFEAAGAFAGDFAPGSRARVFAALAARFSEAAAFDIAETGACEAAAELIYHAARLEQLSDLSLAIEEGRAQERSVMH